MTEYESFPEWSDALNAGVTAAREEGMSAEEVSRAFARERAEFYAARSAAFIRATQGRGKPLSKMTHGDGKRVGEK